MNVTTLASKFILITPTIHSSIDRRQNMIAIAGTGWNHLSNLFDLLRQCNEEKNAGQLLLNENDAMNLGQLQSLSKGWFPNLKLPFTSWGQVISIIQEGTLSSDLTRLLCQPKILTISSVKTTPSHYADAFQGPAFLLQEWKQCHRPSHWHALASVPHRWTFFGEATCRR